VVLAAGLYALEHHIGRLEQDHTHARLIAEACGLDLAGVATNIVVIDVPDAPALAAAAAERGIRIGAVGPRRVRLLTHLDVTAADARRSEQ
jgi:threonine aldolase